MDKKSWRISDLIDLEFFLDRDEGEDLEQLAARDRELYTSLVAQSGGTKPSAPGLLRGWLEARRRDFITKSDKESPIPGQVWDELFVLFSWGCLAGGLLSGGGLAFSFLSYSGVRPVNVSAYFGIFVVLEAILFIVLLSASAYRRLPGRQAEGLLLYRLVQRSFSRGLDRISRKAVSRTSADTRLQWSARRGMVRQLQQRHSALFSRPFFLLAQLLGAGFNGGILGATLLKVIGSDVAFGWQTTLQVGTGTVSALVHWISLPWSWLGPGICCPTPEQIEGSKLILKDGIYHLATPDLVSWWPFLCMAVLVYGLLPRLVLLLVTWYRQRRDLAALSFEHGRYRQLVHRMRTPALTTRARVEVRPDLSPEAGSQPEADLSSRKTQQPQPAPPGSLLALVPDEICADISREELGEVVRERLGYRLAALVPVFTLDLLPEQELRLIAQTMKEENCDDILLLQEAWQPPIEEMLRFLGSLRQTLGEKPTIVLALVGKPAPETVLTPVKPLNLQIWQKKIAVLADAGLQLVVLVK